MYSEYFKLLAVYLTSFKKEQETRHNVAFYCTGNRRSGHALCIMGNSIQSIELPALKNTQTHTHTPALVGFLVIAGLRLISQPGQGGV